MHLPCCDCGTGAGQYGKTHRLRAHSGNAKLPELGLTIRPQKYTQQLDLGYDASQQRGRIGRVQGHSGDIQSSQREQCDHMLDRGLEIQGDVTRPITFNRGIPRQQALGKCRRVCIQLGVAHHTIRRP